MTPSLPRTLSVRRILTDARLDRINFLNEVVAAYPDAVSFAPGRPLDDLCASHDPIAAVLSYVEWRAQIDGCSTSDIWTELAQYTHTRGICNREIATYLRLDEGIDVSSDAIVVTVGAQEALALILLTLFEPGFDVLLTSELSYVGVTGLAALLGIEVVTVPVTDAGLDPLALDAVARTVSRRARVRGFYDVPDFNNPLGTCMSEVNRKTLLDVCETWNMWMIEDNPYGQFAYDDPPRQTLKAIDHTQRVLYVGSFAKTLMPGLRIGYVVADQRLLDAPLANQLSKTKSFLTVNTPPITQAVLAGLLRSQGGSLKSLVEIKRSQYRRHRDTMLQCLHAHMPPDVTWHSPRGGFFLPLTLPFPFDDDALVRCAGHGVLVCPMRYFSDRDSRNRQIRLSFSFTSPDAIAVGVERLGRFITSERQRT